uniref:Ribosomal protein L14 n=1 Tax=Chlorokybus atmophyticus TaxID=3144 RepID=A6YEA8_CHLAT|nr:ribosomal protein L14 [Chlorokybus atmophyticus]ABO15109.1 ribosomal protein L14 [Chlorokybus atmophyticus]
MISVGTGLQISDNSSAKLVKCIKVLGRGNNRNPAFIGDTIVVSLKAVTAKRPRSKINQGEVHKAVIVEMKKKLSRKDGNYLQFNRNAGILINSQMLPIGTRVLGIVTYELRRKGYFKILSLSPIVV